MSPQLACTVHSDTFGTVGYLVIHNRVHGRACGGVRLVPDISLEEMRSAARTMAYKSGFIGFPMGGAKAAIHMDDAREPYKEEILATFGQALSSLIRTGAYLPGTDMNSTVEDLQSILQGAGRRQNLAPWKNRTHIYTAWSCFVSTLVALDTRGIEPCNATFAVQGFGKVASHYVRLMSGAGAKLVAVSNHRTALANGRGFDVDDLLKYRETKQEACLAHYPHAERVTHAEVLEAPVTVLLPAARAWAIHEHNYQAIKAPIMICAANVAMDDDMERRLVENGKIVIPDFVANCGGLFGSVLDHEVKPAVIWHLLNTTYRQKIAHLLGRAEQTHEPISASAGNEAEHRMEAWSAGQRSWPQRIGRKLWSVAPEHIRTKRHVRFYAQLWKVENEKG